MATSFRSLPFCLLGSSLGLTCSSPAGRPINLLKRRLTPFLFPLFRQCVNRNPLPIRLAIKFNELTDNAGSSGRRRLVREIFGFQANEYRIGLGNLSLPLPSLLGLVNGRIVIDDFSVPLSSSGLIRRNPLSDLLVLGRVKFLRFTSCFSGFGGCFVPFTAAIRCSILNLPNGSAVAEKIGLNRRGLASISSRRPNEALVLDCWRSPSAGLLAAREDGGPSSCRP